MYEIIEIFIIGLASFIFAFVVYIIIALKYYEKKIKKIKDMSVDVEEMIIASLKEIKVQQGEIFSRINKLEISVAEIKVKLFIYASLVGAITSGIFTFVFKTI